MKYDITFKRHRSKDRSAAKSDWHYEQKFGKHQVVAADLEENAPFLARALQEWIHLTFWFEGKNDIFVSGIFDTELLPDEIEKRLRSCANPTLAEGITIEPATDHCDLVGMSDAFNKEFIPAQRRHGAKRVEGGAARARRGPQDFEMYPAVLIVGRPISR
jgi:hypothetical protein